MKPAIALALLLLAACNRTPAPTVDAEPALAPVAIAREPEPEPPPVITLEDLRLLSLDCAGTDPAWELDIEANGRGQLGDESGDTDLVGALAFEGDGLAYRAAPADSPSATFAARFVNGACVIKGVQPETPFVAEASFADGRRASACCSARFGLNVLGAPEFDPAAARDWSQKLATDTALVQRCAIDAGVDTRAVTLVRSGDAGKLIVRLRDSDGARFDCLIDRDNRAIEAIAAVADDDHFAAESRSEWLPADPDALPLVNCGRVFRQSDGEGVTAWVHERSGC